MNALIVGCGSLYGKQLTEQLRKSGYTAYGISGTESAETNTLKIDWNTCGIQDFEKFLRKLPQLDLVVFNQNSPALVDEYIKLNSIDIFSVWKRAKQWNQSHYINCILPTHILHTLALTSKLMDDSTVVWILSKSMIGHDQSTPVDYVGQKYQNYITLKSLSLHNPQTFIGICPGKLDNNNRSHKAKITTDFLTTATKNYSGKLFLQNENGIIESHPD